jgi:hypothetical protein
MVQFYFPLYQTLLASVQERKTSGAFTNGDHGENLLNLPFTNGELLAPSTLDILRTRAASPRFWSEGTSLFFLSMGTYYFAYSKLVSRGDL